MINENIKKGFYVVGATAAALVFLTILWAGIDEELGMKILITIGLVVLLVRAIFELYDKKNDAANDKY